MNGKPFSISSQLIFPMKNPSLLFFILTLEGYPSLVVQDAKPFPEQITFFQTRIRPVLADACYEGHSNEEGRIKSGLALDSCEGLRLFPEIQRTDCQV